MQPVMVLQEKGLVLKLKFGDHVAIRHCYFPIALWLGDIKSQDMLAGRVLSHSRGLPRPVWQCNCTHDELDDETAVCESFSAVEYKKMVSGCEEITVYDAEREMFIGGSATEGQRAQYLQQLQHGVEAVGDPWQAEPIMSSERFQEYAANLKSRGCVRVDSVLNQLHFGGTEYGQFGSLSVDTLHALLGGLFKNVVGEFMRGMPSAMKELFEEIADRMFLGQRSSENRYMPRMNFTHGCTNLTELTCREWVGLMLTVLVVCNSYSGEAVLSKLVKKTNRQIAQQNQEQEEEEEDEAALEDPNSPVVTDNDGSSDDGDRDFTPAKRTPDPIETGVVGADMIGTAEQMLALFGYYNHRTFWKKGDTGSGDYFQQSCDIVLSQLKNKCPRTVGNGWKLAKTHAMLKLARAHIDRFGSLRHADCNMVERMLQYSAITPSGNTNRQSYDQVTKTTALNLDVSILINEAEAKIFETSKGAAVDDDDIEFNGTFLSAEAGPTHLIQYVPRVTERSTPELAGESPCMFRGNPSYMVGYFEDMGNGVEFSGRWRKSKSVHHQEAPEIVVRHLKNHVGSLLSRPSFGKVECYTEMFLPTGKRIRCHPNYRGKGMRHDWVLLKKDPFDGVNRLFTGFVGSEHTPSPHFYANTPTVLDSTMTAVPCCGRTTAQSNLPRRKGYTKGAVIVLGSTINPAVYRMTVEHSTIKSSSGSLWSKHFLVFWASRDNAKPWPCLNQRILIS